MVKFSLLGSFFLLPCYHLLASFQANKHGLTKKKEDAFRSSTLALLFPLFEREARKRGKEREKESEREREIEREREGERERERKREKREGKKELGNLRRLG